jgi:predicted RNase H-like HicB family nuclease
MRMMIPKNRDSSGICARYSIHERFAGQHCRSAAAARDRAGRRRLQALVGACWAVGASGTLPFVTFTIELEREADGRWLADVPALPGVSCYGTDRDEAVARVQALALRVIAERLEHREAPAEFVNVTFQAA